MSYDRPPMPIPGQKPELPKRHHKLFNKLAEKFEALTTNPAPNTSNAASAFATSSVSAAFNGSNDNNFTPSTITTSSYDTSLFSPVSHDDPSSYFGSTTHPVSTAPVSDASNGPIETNKFYGNMMLEDQGCTIWTNPYSLQFARAGDRPGLGVCHIRDSQKVYGPGNPAEFYLNPIGIKSFIFGACEFNSELRLSLAKCTQFSSELTISQTASSQGSIVVPVVQGMGFATALYSNLTVKLTSVIGFKSMQASSVGNTKKYIVTLFDEVVWSVYLSGDANVSLDLRDGAIVASGPSQNVVVQICSGAYPFYDQTAGIYPTSIELLAKSVSATTAKYCFKFNCAGSSQANSPLVWAYPHHVQSLTSSVAQRSVGFQLDSTIYGKMSAFVTDTLEFEEADLPTNIGFDPWSENNNFKPSSYSSASAKIQKALEIETNDDVQGFTNLDSMYFAGKQFNKYAYILYVAHYIARDQQRTQSVMDKLKQAFDRFIKNQQINPLVYDKSFGGVVSTAGLKTDPNLDFGNSYYNDHHFHYCYFVCAAAILAKIDRELGGNWLDQNKTYINFLVRDFANPSEQDRFFPVFRSFDWFAGHSVAKGLFASADGKDQESSSEDYHSLYSLKLWGNVIGDKAMEFRANLQLAIMKRVCDNYILMKNDNQNQPKQFIGNKVPGIMFDNKCHHATYFGANLEYIQGIHMIPFTPISPYIRTKQFVREEWDQLLASHVNNVNDGWKGILMLNTVLMDPRMAWSFFGVENFNRGWLDGGMSLTWSLAYIAGMGGC